MCLIKEFELISPLLVIGTIGNLLLGGEKERDAAECPVEMLYMLCLDANLFGNVLGGSLLRFSF